MVSLKWLSPFMLKMHKILYNFRKTENRKIHFFKRRVSVKNGFQLKTHGNQKELILGWLKLNSQYIYR